MIEKLENNEHILLMFLAGELPAQDHLDVAQMLNADASLRRELETLQSAQQLLTEQLELLDDHSALPVSADFAARSVGREIRQRLACPKVVERPARVEAPVRSWRWFYPTAAAASIAVIAMVWLGQQAKMPPNSPYASSYVPSMSESDADTTALLIRSLQQPLEVDPSEVKASPEEDPKQVALGASDGMPQDEISQYLLSTAAAGQ